MNQPRARPRLANVNGAQGAAAVQMKANVRARVYSLLLLLLLYSTLYDAGALEVHRLRERILDLEGELEAARAAAVDAATARDDNDVDAELGA